MSKKDQFIFSYSSKQQDEIKYIKEKYTNDSEGGINKIRELDRMVDRKSSFVVIILGIVSVFIFGGGMSAFLTREEMFFKVFGIMLSICGIVLGLSTHSLYPFIHKKYSEKYGPEIVKLCEKLLENQPK